MHKHNTAFRFTRLPTSPNSPNTNVTDIHHDLQVLHFTVERGPPQKKVDPSFLRGSDARRFEFLGIEETDLTYQVST